ncbi:hypothetical protein DSO57_1029270 [Entomophthora muscae]|uniref:Uncharacterized protein n=1 Tax=Entomophthora muscae TaxID=34485 RepID=A0ACC2TZV9_9FUNG|nr:hypothetical protein DSO57_1029270 [Entomophthora muscae]
MKSSKDLYKRYTSDTLGTTKHMVGRYPPLQFLKKDGIWKAVKLLDADVWDMDNKELMAGFIGYFKDLWAGKLVEKRSGLGKNKIGCNYIDFVLAEGTKTTSAQEG